MATLEPLLPSSTIAHQCSTRCDLSLALLEQIHTAPDLTQHLSRGRMSPHQATFPSVQAWSHFIIARGAPVPTVMRQLDCFALEAAPCAPQIYRSFAQLNSIAVLVVKRLDLRDSKTAQNNCLLVPLLHAMHTCGCKNRLLCKPSFKLHLSNAGRLRKRCWINSAQAKRSIKCINQVFPIFPLAFTARTS